MHQATILTELLYRTADVAPKLLGFGVHYHIGISSPTGAALQALAGLGAQHSRILPVYGNNYVQLTYELEIKNLKTSTIYDFPNFKRIHVRAGHNFFKNNIISYKLFKTYAS